MLLFDQLYVAPGTEPENAISAVESPLHTAWLVTGSTDGMGLIVTVIG